MILCFKLEQFLLIQHIRQNKENYIMAFNGISFGPLTNAPLINVTNVSFPNLNQDPVEEEAIADTPETSPAVIISLSEDAQSLVTEGANTAAPAQQPADEPTTAGIGNEQSGAIAAPLENNDPLINVTETESEPSRFDLLRTEIASIVESNNLSRPERTVLNRALEGTGLENITAQDTPQDLETGSGQTVDIERNLIDLFQSNLNLSPSNSFNNLSALFSNLATSIQE